MQGVEQTFTKGYKIVFAQNAEPLEKRKHKNIILWKRLERMIFNMCKIMDEFKVAYDDFQMKIEKNFAPPLLLISLKQN